MRLLTGLILLSFPCFLLLLVVTKRTNLLRYGIVSSKDSLQNKAPVKNENPYVLG
jgi:hypothetical protein